MISLTTSGLPVNLKERDLRDVFVEVFKATRRKPSGGVSVTCIGDARMSSLNREYRKKTSTTDVLSFHPSSKVPQVGDKEWGDIFISPSYVRKEAKRRKIEFKEEMLRVAAHGMLHLMGYDHAKASDELRMFSLQEKAVAKALGNL